MFIKLFRFLRWSTIAAGLIFAATMTSAPFLIYERLDTEKPIAKITFSETADDRYLVNFSRTDFCRVEHYRLHGQQAQLDASFLKWQSWVNLIGVESIYRIDRLSGRFRDQFESIDNSRGIINLRQPVVIDPFYETRLDGRGNWLVASQFGASVYFDIDTSLEYSIFKTEDALIVKSKPLLVNTDILSIEINTNCFESPGPWQKFSLFINDQFVQLL